MDEDFLKECNVKSVGFHEPTHLWLRFYLMNKDGQPLVSVGQHHFSHDELTVRARMNWWFSRFYETVLEALCRSNNEVRTQISCAVKYTKHVDGGGELIVYKSPKSCTLNDLYLEHRAKQEAGLETFTQNLAS